MLTLLQVRLSHRNYERIAVTTTRHSAVAVGRDISVGIATRNGLDGPGIESR
jgi:hypothetical protein